MSDYSKDESSFRNQASRSFASSALAVAALAALTVFFGGCINVSTCDRSPEANPPQRFTGGVTFDGVYQSSLSWHEGYLRYPGGKQYEFVHNLGVVPTNIDVFLAFEENPRGNVAKCVGDTCLITGDEQVIRLQNFTCADFWVRVIADSRGSLSRLVDGSAPSSPDVASDAADDVP